MKGYRLLQMLPWATLLGLLIVGDQLTAYAAGWLRYLLIAALILIVLLAALGMTNLQRGKRPSAAEFLVHLLPLFVLLVIKPGDLRGSSLHSSQPYLPELVEVEGDSSAVERDDREPSGETGEGHADADPDADDDGDVSAEPDDEGPTERDPVPPQMRSVHIQPAAGAGAGRDDAEGDAELPPGYSAPTLMQTYQPPYTAEVHKVELFGRLHRRGEGDQLPVSLLSDEDQVLLYRYLIACCAADASPVLVVMRGEVPEQLEADDWLRVRGRLLPRNRERRLPVLEIEQMRKVEPPSDPYLYQELW